MTKLYEKEYPITSDGECGICGRLKHVADSECRCGEIVRNLACPAHARYLRVTAIPIYRGEPRHISHWVNIFECSIMGCGYVRAFKNGQGVPRNKNRKGK